MLTALQATTLSYLRRDGDAIAFWRMATARTDELRARADAIAAKATAATVVDTEAVPGGGTLPGVTIPSVGLAVDGDHARALRERDRPLIARVAPAPDSMTIVDLRTIDSEDDGEVAAALATIDP